MKIFITILGIYNLLEKSIVLVVKQGRIEKGGIEISRCVTLTWSRSASCSTGSANGHCFAMSAVAHEQ